MGQQIIHSHAIRGLLTLLENDRLPAKMQEYEIAKIDIYVAELNFMLKSDSQYQQNRNKNTEIMTN